MEDNTVLFENFGNHLRIHCAYGREFDNTLIKDLRALFDMKLTSSSFNHLESNGSIERFQTTRVNLEENPNETPLNVFPYASICYKNTKNKMDMDLLHIN